jgi:hypothetical protein
MVSTPSRPAGEGFEEPASAEDLEQARRWAEGSDPVLAKFGRATLAMAGVVDATEPVVAQVEPVSSPEVPPANAATSTPTLHASCPPRPARIATPRRSAPRSRPPSARHQGPRHVLEGLVAKPDPSPVLAFSMTRSP